MTIQAVIQPYEILIRFTGGHPTGYHYKTIEVVTDGERVFSATESQPLPIEGEQVAAVLGETLQVALLRAQQLEAQLADANAQVAQLQQELSALAGSNGAA